MERISSKSMLILLLWLRTTPCQLHPVPQGLKLRFQQVPSVGLDFNEAIAHRAAHTELRFEGFSEFLELSFRCENSVYQTDAPALPPFGLAMDAHDAIPLRDDGFFWLVVRAYTARFGRINQIARI